MRNTIFLILSVSLLSAALLGCQAKEKEVINSDNGVVEQETSEQGLVEQQPSKNEPLKLAGNFKMVSITKSKDDRSTVFEDDHSLEVLEAVFSSAVTGNTVTMDDKPRYYVEIIFEKEEKQSFHLGIGTKSTLTETDHPYILYLLSKESTSKLIDLMEEWLVMNLF